MKSAQACMCCFLLFGPRSLGAAPDSLRPVPGSAAACDVLELANGDHLTGHVLEENFLELLFVWNGSVLHIGRRHLDRVVYHRAEARIFYKGEKGMLVVPALSIGSELVVVKDESEYRLPWKKNMRLKRLAATTGVARGTACLPASYRISAKDMRFSNGDRMSGLFRWVDVDVALIETEYGLYRVSLGDLKRQTPSPGTKR